MKSWAITIERPLGGWGLDYSQSNSAAIETRPDQYSQSSAISPFRPGFFGHISSGETFTALTDSGNRVTAKPANAVATSDGSMFAVLRNARLVKFSTSAVTANYDVTPHGGHNLVTGDNSDVLAFKDAAGTPVEYLLWSWEDDTDADVAIIKADGSSQDDDRFSTLTSGAVLTKGVPHMMAVGPDGHIYGTNGQYLFSITVTGALTAATGNAQALNLGVGWVASSITAFQNFIAIVGYQGTVSSSTSAMSRMWLWDGFSPKPNFVYDIPDHQATKILNDNGVLRVFTQGKNNTTKIKRFTGSSFVDVFESAQVGPSPLHGWVDIFQGMPHWAAGQLVNCLYNEGFHQRTLLASSNNAGMVKNINSNLLFVADGNTIKKINYTGYNGGSFRTGLFSVPYRSNGVVVTVYLSEYASGASLTLSLFKDYNTVSVGGAADLLYAQLPFSTYGAVSSISIKKTITDLNSFFMVLTLSGQVSIRKIVVEGTTSDKP